MDRERSGRREQQRVIVIGIDERGDRHDAVGAGPVLDHHGLPPPLGQPIRKKPRADVRSGSGPERNDEPDRTLRPALRVRDRERGQKGGGQGEKDAEPVCHGRHRSPL